jgi:hypothetical protein
MTVKTFLFALWRSWLDLTAREQKAVLLVLALFLLGLAVRLWHDCHSTRWTEPYVRAPSGQRGG